MILLTIASLAITSPARADGPVNGVAYMTNDGLFIRYADGSIKQISTNPWYTFPELKDDGSVCFQDLWVMRCTIGGGYWIDQNRRPSMKIEPVCPSYTGNSIDDCLKSVGRNISPCTASAITSRYGIYGYTGTASQNLQILTKLKYGGDGNPWANYFPMVFDEGTAQFKILR